MAELRRRRSVSQTLLLDLLVGQLDAWREAERPGLVVDVVDLGGGTGGVAIGLAQLGYRVRVVDPSPDALASLERRTAEAGLSGQIRGIQGDTTELLELVGEEGTDAVVCHRVLEVVEMPEEALRAMASVLRGRGVLSLVVSQRQSLVLAQALAGHLAQARRTFADPGRFDYGGVLDLVRAGGLHVLESHGIGAVADHVDDALIETEPGAHAELLALEFEISRDPVFRAMAPQLHVFAQRP